MAMTRTEGYGWQYHISTSLRYKHISAVNLTDSCTVTLKFNIELICSSITLWKNDPTKPIFPIVMAASATKDEKMNYSPLIYTKKI